MSSLIFRNNQGSRFSLSNFIVKPILSNVIKGVINKFKYDKSQRMLNVKEKMLVEMNRQAYRNPETRQDVGFAKYQPQLSNRELAVFKAEKFDIIYIIYKGTSNQENLITDLKLITNIPDRTFKQALEQYDLINKMFPNSQKIVSGHSLGGSKAMFVADKRNIKGVVFNPFTPNVGGVVFNVSRNTPQITKIVNRDDILSNKQLIINPPGLVVMVLKFKERGILGSHSINTLSFPDKYLF